MSADTYVLHVNIVQIVSIILNRGDFNITIKELLRNNKQISTLVVKVDVYVRGITKQVIIGKLNVIRDKDSKYMSLETLQDVNVTEDDSVLEWRILTCCDIELKVNSDY